MAYITYIAGQEGAPEAALKSGNGHSENSHLI